MLLRGKREFYIFHTLCKKNKKQKKRQKWVRFFGSSFFCQKKRETKKRQNFFQNKSFILSFIFFSSSLLLILFCGVSLPRSEDHKQRKFLRVVLLSKNTEREALTFLFLKRRREL